MMEVILKQDVEKLGKATDIVKVKDGYARNYLIPQNLAIPLTPQNLKKIQREKEVKLKELEENKRQASELAQKIAGKSFTIACQVHEEDKLYGSITSQEIARVLEEEGFKINKKCILLEEPIKSTGVYEIPVKLHPEVTTHIRIWVVKK
ncbi:MAG: 50S ribosomal protein L9 [Candidatus Omnitrophica bacterium]|nr:50S ribosomal protein L9 [Candidatus Omnitrophota bacterium]MCM8771112.1 50S ribosomal protein L9 [Candidatus Omnitrophota bacterium]